MILPRDLCNEFRPIDQFHKSQNAPVLYPTILHSEQKCAHFCSEWSIVGYGTGAFWDLWIRSVGSTRIFYVWRAVRSDMKARLAVKDGLFRSSIISIMAITGVLYLPKLCCFLFNSLWPSDTIWQCTTLLPFVQVKVCRLFGDKPLPEPMLTYC